MTGTLTTTPYLAARAARLSALRAERAEVRAYLRDADRREAAYLDAAGAVRRVALVVGSPRGGTSAFTAVLARGDNALALPGEHRHLFTLVGANFPDHGGWGECGDAEALSDEAVAIVRDELRADAAGVPVADPGAADVERSAWEWALRFQLQWPELDVAIDTVATVVHDAVRALRSPDGTVPSPDRLVADILGRLLDGGIPVDPFLYALDADVLRAAFGERPLPTRAPASTVIEISPYLVVGPTRRPVVGDDAVFVLKASSDAFRLPTLRRVFEGFDVRFLHLVRNPLAAVNGLLDGWAHHCFWQHDLSPFGMPDVDDPARPGSWWKFDLFDDWRAVYDAPLPELCARQWLSSHERILAECDDAPRLRFEAFQAADLRAAVMEAAADQLGVVHGAGFADAVARPPVVNSTAAPVAGRWRARPDVTDVLSVPGVRRMATALGYDDTPEEWA